MILDFGYICMEMRTKINCALETCESSITATQNTMTPGGSATLQAIAAARCGAQVSLSGAIGNDLFAKTILDVLRKNGVRSTSIAKSEGLTDITTHIISPEKSFIITSSNSNDIASEEQITDQILNTRTLLTIQNDFPLEKNLPLLKRAKERECFTSLSLSHTQNLSEDMLQWIDTLIIEDKVLTDLANLWNIPEETLPQTITKNHDLHCITLKEHGLNGVEFCSRKQEMTIIPPVTNITPTDPSAAFNIFCGAFNACIQAAKPVETALIYGQAAAVLSTQKHGAYTSMPYLGDIEDYIENNL